MTTNKKNVRKLLKFGEQWLNKGRRRNFIGNKKCALLIFLGEWTANNLNCKSKSNLNFLE